MPVRKSIRRSALILLALLSIPAAQAAAPLQPAHYDVQAQIDPASGEMQVSLDMDLRPGPDQREISFLLHADLQLQSLEGDALDAFEVAPYEWPGAPHLEHITQVTVTLGESATAGQPVALQWRYGGTLQDDHIEMGQAAMTPHWMELPAEALWVPLESNARLRFTWQAAVELPEDYQLVGTGPELRDGNRWELSSTQPSIDIPLIASDRLQSRESVLEGGITVRVHHDASDESLVDYVSRHATEVVSRYTTRFRTPLQAQELDIALSPLKRETAHSYARPGVIGLSHGIEPGPRLFQLLAHEAAHLWWSNARDAWSRHNFLNESFAEYFAWVELGRVYGQDEYEDRVAKARESARESPSFNDWTQEANGLLSYVKGPLLLHDLHARIGPETFDRFVRSLQADRVDTIEGMLETLETAAGPTHAQWLTDAL